MVHTFIRINMGNQLTNSCIYKIKLSATTFKIKTRKKISTSIILVKYYIIQHIFKQTNPFSKKRHFKKICLTQQSFLSTVRYRQKYRSENDYISIQKT